MKKFLVSLLIVLALPFSALAAAKYEYLYVIKDDFIDSSTALVVRTAPLYKGEFWVVEYGVGCPSMWLYENKKIIASYSLWLEGIGGKLYLPKRTQSCRIWEAKNIKDVVDDLRDEDWEWLSDNGYL